MTTFHDYGRQAKEIADAKIASGTWAKIGRSHYRRETGEEVRRDGNKGWQIIGGNQPRKWFYTSRYEAMHQVDRKYEATP